MTNIDQASLRAVEKSLSQDKNYAPKERSLSDLIALMEQQSEKLNQTIVQAKKVLEMIVGGLK